MYKDDLTEEQIKETMPSFCIMDLMIRGMMRGKVVKELVDNGIKVHLVGGGWEELECEHPENMVLYGTMNSKGCLEIQRKSKINLNVMPWFKDGAHDRVFNSILNDAVCVSDESRYLREELAEGEGLCYYDLSQLEELPKLVKSLLVDEKRREEIL